jgi:hypothetical protein
MSGIAAKFKMTLEADGLWAALRWLNDRVPYGFTPIFAFDGDMLRNICLIDKENQSTTKCSDQPITESYCLYVLLVRTSLRRAFQFGGSLAGQERCASSQTPKCSVLLRHSTV